MSCRKYIDGATKWTLTGIALLHVAQYIVVPRLAVDTDCALHRRNHGLEDVVLLEPVNDLSEPSKVPKKCSNVMHCSGVLMRADLVLTAATCTGLTEVINETMAPIFPIKASQLDDKVSVIDTRLVVEQYTHPDFNMSMRHANLALLLLESVFTAYEKTPFIPIPFIEMGQVVDKFKHSPEHEQIDDSPLESRREIKHEWYSTSALFRPIRPDQILTRNYHVPIKIARHPEICPLTIEQYFYNKSLFDMVTIGKKNPNYFQYFCTDDSNSYPYWNCEGDIGGPLWRIGRIPYRDGKAGWFKLTPSGWCDHNHQLAGILTYIYSPHFPFCTIDCQKAIRFDIPARTHELRHRCLESYMNRLQFTAMNMYVRNWIEGVMTKTVKMTGAPPSSPCPTTKTTRVTRNITSNRTRRTTVYDAYYDADLYRTEKDFMLPNKNVCPSAGTPAAVMPPLVSGLPSTKSLLLLLLIVLCSRSLTKL